MLGSDGTRTTRQARSIVPATKGSRCYYSGFIFSKIPRIVHSVPGGAPRQRSQRGGLTRAKPHIVGARRRQSTKREAAARARVVNSHHATKCLSQDILLQMLYFFFVNVYFVARLLQNHDQKKYEKKLLL
jgi:hypothetical protein